MNDGTLVKSYPECSIYKLTAESIAKRRMNKKRQHAVSFSSKMKINTFDPIVDPEIEKALCYSRDDFWLFLKRLKVAIVLQSRMKSIEDLQIKMKDNQAYHDYLERKNAECTTHTTSRKREFGIWAGEIGKAAAIADNQVSGLENAGADAGGHCAYNRPISLKTKQSSVLNKGLEEGHTHRMQRTPSSIENVV